MGDDRSDLEAVLEGSLGSRTFPWDGTNGDDLVRAAARLLDAGYAVRLSLVGYGMAVRLALTDGRGWSAGWTVASGAELQRLLGALLTAGALDWVQRNLSKPLKRR